MDWENERYVRLYTRDTTAWVMWRWEARAFLPNLMRKLDRSGRTPFDKKYGVKGIAALVQLPLEVVKAGLDELLEDGTLQIEGEYLAMPNFADAQTARQSAARRKEDQRQRDKLEQEARRVTDVTACDAGHSSLAEPSLAEPSRTDPPSPPAAAGERPALAAVPSAAHEQDASGPMAQVQALEAGATIAAAAKAGKAKRKAGKEPSLDGLRVLERMAQLAGCRYGYSAALEARLRDGASVEDCLAVVEHLARDPWWLEKRFCSPDAPFRTDKFPGYLAQARAQRPLPLASSAGPPAPIPIRGRSPAPVAPEYRSLE